MKRLIRPVAAAAAVFLILGCLGAQGANLFKFSFPFKAAGKNFLAGAGAEVVAEPKAFYVKGKDGPLFEGELEKARAWAEMIKKKAGLD